MGRLVSDVGASFGAGTGGLRTASSTSCSSSPPRGCPAFELRKFLIYRDRQNLIVDAQEPCVNLPPRNVLLDEVFNAGK